MFVKRCLHGVCIFSLPSIVQICWYYIHDKLADFLSFLFNLVIFDAGYMVSHYMSTYLSAINVREGGGGRSWRDSLVLQLFKFYHSQQLIKMEIVKLLTFVLRITWELFVCASCRAAILLIYETIGDKGTGESQRKKKHSWPLAIFSKKGESYKDGPRERPGGEFKDGRHTEARLMIKNITM